MYVSVGSSGKEPAPETPKHQASPGGALYAHVVGGGLASAYASADGREPAFTNADARSEALRESIAALRLLEPSSPRRTAWLHAIRSLASGTCAECCAGRWQRLRPLLRSRMWTTVPRRRA